MSRPLSILAAAALAVPGLARAQQPEAPAAPPAPAPAVKAPDTAGDKDSALPNAADTTPRDFGGASDPAELRGLSSDNHRVERGDTLWDISGKYFSDPWYWPKVWSYNPQIENPHWIYPGDDVRLYPDGTPEDGEDREELPDVSKGTLQQPGYGEEDDVTVAGKVGFAGISGGSVMLSRHDGFVTARELAESATIKKAWEERDYLVQGDKIYLDWRDRRELQAGQEYVIFRTARRVEHPETGEDLGFLTQILGKAKVTEVGRDGLVTATITRSFTEIVRGDYVGPVAGVFARPVSRKPVSKDAVGVVVATLEPGADAFGQWSVVFVDLGRRHGVEEGNVLTIVRAGDGLDEAGSRPYYDPEAPAEKLAELLVVDTKDATAAALVTRAIREIRIGDRVEARAASTTAAADAAE